MSIKEDIFTMIKRHEAGVSFVNLKRIDGFEGDGSMRSGEFKNVIFWNGISKEAIEAIADLIKENKIKATQTSPMIYLFDGVTLNLKIAQRQRSYKDMRWMPICFSYIDKENNTVITD